MTLSSGTSAVTSCASVSERIHSSSSNCFEVGSFLLPLEHELRVEEETALFRQVSRRHLLVRVLRPRNQAPSLASSCEGDNGIQMFLSFTCWPRSTHGRQFDVQDRRDTCFATPLFPHCASR